MLVPLTLLDFLERGATCYGQRTIIDEPGAGSLGTITYAQLDAFARSLACALDDLGLPKGARVAIVSPNSARYLVAMFGVSAFGRVLVPVNYRLQPNEVDYIVRHSGAALVLADGETASRLQRESSAAAEQQAAALPSSTGAQCQPRVVLLGPETDGQLFLRPPHASTPRHTVADENDLVSATCDWYGEALWTRPQTQRP